MIEENDNKEWNERKQVINTCEVEHENYEDLVDTASKVREVSNKGKEELPTYNRLVEDIYNSLYKYNPALKNIEEVNKEYRNNQVIMDKVMRTGEYNELRLHCKNDSIASAMGTIYIGNKLIEVIERIKEKKKEQQDNSAKSSNKEENKEQSEQQDNNNQQEQTSTIKEEQKLKDKQDITEEELKEELNIGLFTLSKEMNNIKQDINKYKDIDKTWGFSLDGSNMSLDSKLNLIEKIKNSKKLMKLTNMLGQFRETAITEQKKKIKDGAIEIDTVSVGNSIENALPSEKLKLCKEETKKDFYKKLIENSLIEYKKSEISNKNKGPIIICVDTSGSMIGRKELWSKSITIAVLNIAQLQKRDFACIIYSHYALDPIIIKKEEKAPEKVYKCACEFINGGTNYTDPLIKSLELINKSRFKNADILFISDGISELRKEIQNKFNRIKKEKEFRCIGLKLGREDAAVMRTFCDEVIEITSMKDLQESDTDINKLIFNAI